MAENKKKKKKKKKTKQERGSVKITNPRKK